MKKKNQLPTKSAKINSRPPDLVSDTQKLKLSTEQIASDIVNANDAKEVKDLVTLFNLAQVKKNIIRTLKYNDLLDLVSESMLERFIKRPDEFSHKDLIDYMNTLTNALDKSAKGVQTVDTENIIQQITNQQNIQVNVNNDSGLDRESRERVTEAIQAILAKAQTQPINIDNEVNKGENENGNN